MKNSNVKASEKLEIPMGLLSDIQAELLNTGSSLGSILLKLRFLADRLDSNILEDWVRHELEGYPEDIEVPNYRRAGVTYSGTFSNGYQQLNDVSIPSHSVKKYAGEDWVQYSIRDPLSVIDDIVVRTAGEADASQFSLNTGDLKIALHDKIYKDFPIIEIRGVFSVGAFISIQSTVRAKILDLSLQLEKEVPAAGDIVIGEKLSKGADINSEKVTSVTSQIINYGNVTNINSAGPSAEISVNITQGSTEELVIALSKHGMPKQDAEEFAQIVSDEQSEASDKPLGKKAAAWLKRKVEQGATDAWSVGKAVVTDVVKEAVKQYYGLN